MSKASLHFQRLPGWAYARLRAWGSTWVKIVNPAPGSDPFPGMRKCLRIWTDDWDRECITRGAVGATDYMARMLPQWRQFTGWGEIAFELPNEPDANGNDALAALCEFTARCAVLAHREGLEIVGINAAEGNPHDNGTGNLEVNRWKIVQLAPAIALLDYWGHHGYWCPGVEGPTGEYHALYYRRLFRWVSEVATRVPPMLLTEAGMDGGICGRAQTSWRTLSNREQYVQDVLAFDREVAKDPQVMAYFLFTAGYEQPWGDFDHDEETVITMGQALKAAPLAPTYYQSGRGGHKPAWIVVHDTEGPAGAALAWWTQGAQPAGGGSSAHYLVTAAGNVIPVVPEARAAWHCGGSKLPGVEHAAIGGVSVENLVSIGIELEYPAAPASPQWPQAQLDAAAALVREVAQRYGIPRERVVRHGDIDPANRSDPRGLDWPRFLDAVFPPAPVEDLPESETTTDPATIVEKARWWVEESTREVEAGRYDRARAILVSLANLMYRAEGILKDW